MKLGFQSPSEPSEYSPSASFVRRHGAGILTLVPLLALIGVVVQYAVAVPYLDQWELVPLLEKTYRGDLTFHDLWAQHNEHRIVFPQIIMLVLARLTNWNTHFELVVNILLAVGIFAVFALQIKRTARKLAWDGLSWAIPVASIIVFSVSQWQNWLWGWQLQMFLNLLCVVGGIVLLSDETFSWPRFSAAAALGIVATYSFANGILFWPIGLVILLVTVGAAHRKAALSGWMLIAALTLGTYFYHYRKPEEHPSLSLIFQLPLEYAAYVFKYLGGHCEQGLCGDKAIDASLAWLFGLAGTLALAWAGGMLMRRQIVPFLTLVPYLAMSSYSVGSALITGVGRLGFGSDQALSSRYCTMVTPLWVSLMVFLILLGRGRTDVSPDGPAEPKSVQGPGSWDCRTVARWLLRVFVVLLVLGSLFGIAAAGDLSQVQAYGRARLLDLAAHPQTVTDTNGLFAIYPWPNVVVERYPVLVQHRLSLFRDSNK